MLNDCYLAALNAERSSQQKAVCLSVCQTPGFAKPKFCPDFIYHTKDHLV